MIPASNLVRLKNQAEIRNEDGVQFPQILLKSGMLFTSI